MSFPFASAVFAEGKGDTSLHLMSFIPVASGMGRTMAITCERLEEIETRVKAGQMDATEWCRILHPLPGKVKAWLSIVSPAEALHKTDHAMADKNQGVQQVKELQSKALQDGDMAVAEEASYAIIASVEQLMELVGDKFQVTPSPQCGLGCWAEGLEHLVVWVGWGGLVFHVCGSLTSRRIFAETWPSGVVVAVHNAG